MYPNRQAKANSVDPHETPQNLPSHQCLHWLTVKSERDILIYSASHLIEGVNIFKRNGRGKKINTYHVLGKFSRLASFVGDIFLIFHRKQGLTFHAN